jgi:hypothetical protein
VVAKYVGIITSASTWDDFVALKDDPAATLDQVSSALTSLVFSAAVTAGFRVRTLSSAPAPARRPLPPRTNSSFKCWHDNECKRLQQAARAIPTDTADPAAAAQRAGLLRHYRRRVTRLLRQHKIAHAVEQLRLWRKDTAGFWRNYRPASASCPVTPAAAAAYFDQ